MVLNEVCDFKAMVRMLKSQNFKTEDLEVFSLELILNLVEVSNSELSPVNRLCSWYVKVLFCILVLSQNNFQRK